MREELLSCFDPGLLACREFERLEVVSSLDLLTVSVWIERRHDECEDHDDQDHRARQAAATSGVSSQQPAP